MVNFESPHYSGRSAYASEGTKTRRRDARRSIRNTLGTSSDPAPELIAALHAARELARIIDMASFGRYGLAVVRPKFEGEVTQARLRENFKYGAATKLVHAGNVIEEGSLIYEPSTETVRRELYLKEQERDLEEGSLIYE